MMLEVATPFLIGVPMFLSLVEIKGFRKRWVRIVLIPLELAIVWVSVWLISQDENLRVWGLFALLILLLGIVIGVFRSLARSGARSRGSNLSAR